MMEPIIYTTMGLVAGYALAIIHTKDRWVTADTLREAHWAQDERNRWEIRTGQRLSFDDVSNLRASPHEQGEG